jgi:putative nucleotidyltransferase with HDIG domain
LNLETSGAYHRLVTVLPEELPLGFETSERATVAAVEALAMLVDSRDAGTNVHADRVANLAEELAIALGCTQERARDVYLAGKLHDIGKVAVPDSILRKRGRLTEQEWEVMRRHPSVGANVVSHVDSLARLAPIIRSHHERYDGAGYPEGLHGHRLSIECARQNLRDCAGTQFDPEIVAALDQHLDRQDEHEDVRVPEPVSVI